MYILQVSALCHTVLRSAGAFEKSKIQEWPLDGVSDLVQVSSVAGQGRWVRVASKWRSGQESKGVTRVRASGMLIPTAGLLLLRQASMDVAVSPSRAHAATAAARHARAARVHAVC